MNMKKVEPPICKNCDRVMLPVPKSKVHYIGRDMHICLDCEMVAEKSRMQPEDWGKQFPLRELKNHLLPAMFKFMNGKQYQTKW